ncbi:uncharacterized protein N7511_010174 [Penicillium nucicola]|uniref:uncharacterized protein n=1 Tax=Penicillium nucicola TaxID=1850975 RepID=UPI0025452E78|nr:uncharacterized protein N7511_010174 [Penicillium nucicola]KAJ5748478.1 hypothetical protein N7511_010174 [Penicillium nucicola]
MASDMSPRSALIVVDMQEDFCHPNGSLAVQGGREISSTINALLSKPGFDMRIATQDYHPSDHISFASNHPEPNNKPFISTIKMQNPAPGKESEVKDQQLWPVHCVADTFGAEIIPEIELRRVNFAVQKGMHSLVEMYSVFADAFGNRDPVINRQSVRMDVAAALTLMGINHVFVVGLAGDYCVKHTAMDAVKAGFKTWVIEEATRCVVPEAWGTVKEELEAAGVSVVSMCDPIVQELESNTH